MVWWLVFLGFLEYYSAGVTVLAKRSGMKNYGLCMIPFFSVYYMNKLLGNFTVLTIKVEKWLGLTIKLVIVCALAFIYSQWGLNNLLEVQSTPLTQVMLVPIVVCVFITFMCFVNSTTKALFMMHCSFKGQWLVCATLITIPFMLTCMGDRKISIASR